MLSIWYYPQQAQVAGYINPITLDCHTRQDYWGAHVYIRCRAWPTANHTFKGCGGYDTFTSSTILHKCGAKPAKRAGTLHGENHLEVHYQILETSSGGSLKPDQEGL